MDYLIRNAIDADAPAISQTIINALRQSNAQDYSSEIIDQVAQNFSPLAILQLLDQRQMLVAIVDNHIVATASLDQDVVRSVFVDPSYQGKGLGRHLMESMQSIAINAGLNRLRVPSSITAEGFYSSLGFIKVRDEFHKSERTIIMTKKLDL
ncbi:N-acetyltransferase family protein [Pseudomonas sp. ABY48]|uniref:GNAT family N-acetyltransferase n=1 Tax=Pseudomonas sp. ABY48 TaxID=3402865 RepID=UPI003B433557